MADSMSAIGRRHVLSSFGIGLAGVSVMGKATAQPTDLDSPSVIDEPGSYRLIDDIEADGTCFQIETGGEVSIDGNGYQIRGNGSGTAVELAGTDLRLAEMSITRFGQVMVLHMEDSLTLEHVHVQNCGVGISSIMSDRVVIEHCAFADIEDTVFSFEDLWEEDIRIAHTSIQDSGTALWQDQVWGTELVDTTIENCGRVVMGEGIIEDCVIEHSGGIELFVDIAGGPVERPIPIVDNELRGNDVGVKVRHGHADLRGNTISGNDVGIDLRSDQIDSFGTTTLEHNEIYENGVSIFDGTDGTVDAACNWWGHPTGPRHPDNPVADPEGESAEGDITFLPWLVSSDGSCDGGWTYESAGHGVYTDLPYELVVELAESGAEVTYEIDFSGRVEAGEFAHPPSIHNATASGEMGPDRGLDNIYFDGEIDAIAGTNLDQTRIFIADAQRREILQEIDPSEYQDDSSPDDDPSPGDDEPSHPDDDDPAPPDDDSPPGDDDASPPDDDGPPPADDDAIPPDDADPVDDSDPSSPDDDSEDTEDEDGGGGINETWLFGAVAAGGFAGLTGLAVYFLNKREEFIEADSFE